MHEFFLVERLDASSVAAAARTGWLEYASALSALFTTGLVTIAYNYLGSRDSEERRPHHLRLVMRSGSGVMATSPTAYELDGMSVSGGPRARVNVWVAATVQTRVGAPDKNVRLMQSDGGDGGVWERPATRL